MTDVVISSPFTEAVLAELRTIPNPAGGTVQFGHGRRPDAPAKPPRSFYPYGVVRVSTVTIDGSLVEPKEDGVHRVQVNAVSLDEASAEWLRDQVRALLLDPRSLMVDGYAVVWTDHAASPPTFRDDDVDPPLFEAVTQIDIKVTPASGS